MKKFYITEFSAICNLGNNIEEIFNNAFDDNKKYFSMDNSYIKNQTYPFAKVQNTLPKITTNNYNTRCNQLILNCLNQLNINRILSSYEKHRIGVIVATTNSGVEEFSKTNNKFQLEIGNPAGFIKEHLNLTGYHSSISTACSSGAKVFSLAQKLLENEICDCVITGGADSLANIAIFGFNSLELLSKETTNPFSKNRTGITLGEGAGLFIIEKEKLDDDSIEIAGIGESTDAYHYSTPEPTGEQPIMAIKQALKNAQITPEDIDYINLHGTGTIANDLMEANCIYSIFKNKTPVSSTKSLTGHCLGASASIEAALCCALLSKKLNPENKIYPQIFDEEYDENLPQINLAKKNTKLEKINTVLSNSFGFGGTNATIILRRN